MVRLGLQVFFASVISELLCGCATVVTGGLQNITVTSEPPGALCLVYRRGTTVGEVVTPGLISVRRGEETLEVHCTKEGFDDGQAFMPVKFDATTLGNVALGGVVGLAVDAATGSNLHYDSNVNVSLATLTQPATPSATAPVDPPPREPISPVPTPASNGQSRSRI